MKPLQRHDNLAGTSHPAGQIGDGQPAIVNDCLIAQPTVAHIHTSMTGDRDHRRARRPSRRQPGLGILENQTLTSTRRIGRQPDHRRRTPIRRRIGLRRHIVVAAHIADERALRRLRHHILDDLARGAGHQHGRNVRRRQTGQHIANALNPRQTLLSMRSTSSDRCRTIASPSQSTPHRAADARSREGAPCSASASVSLHSRHRSAPRSPESAPNTDRNRSASVQVEEHGLHHRHPP